MPSYGTLVLTGLDVAGQDEGSDFEDILSASINRMYRLMLQAANADEQRREFSLTTRADTSKYGMPLYVKRVLNIEDAENDKQIYDFSAREFDVTYPGDSTTGDPYKAYPLGVFGVQRQLASSGRLTLVSSSSSDVTNFFVRVTGYVSNVLTTEQVTLTGTTSLQTTNTYDANGIERLVRSSTSGYTITGNITVTDGTNTLSVIPVWWDSPSYLWYEFYPIPSSALTYTVRALMRRPDLVKDEDWPEIDEDFHPTLLHGALAETLPIVGKTAQSQYYQGLFEKEMKDYRSVNGQQPNRVRIFGDSSDQTTYRYQRYPTVVP
jgi:hypothetical protein